MPNAQTQEIDGDLWSGGASPQSNFARAGLTVDVSSENGPDGNDSPQ